MISKREGDESLMARYTRERHEDAAEIRNTRRYLGCDEREKSCVSCQDGCPHEGQTLVDFARDQEQCQNKVARRYSWR